MSNQTYREVSLERMVRAVEQVRIRLLRAARALEASGIPYAVAGGNAVAAWVSRVDEGAARNTRDVDIVIRRDDFKAAKAAMENAGFVYQQVYGVDLFLDGPDGLPSHAVHLLFANEKVKSDYAIAVPDVTESEAADGFQLVALDSLVKMKLTSFRRKDQVHVLDMIGVGLVDQSWCARLPEALAARLQHLLDTPDE
jgi:hypothetical protein